MITEELVRFIGEYGLRDNNDRIKDAGKLLKLTYLTCQSMRF